MVAKTFKKEEKHRKSEGRATKSLRESDIVEESVFDIRNIIDHREALERIKHYVEIIKTENRNTIRYESIQGQMLKKLK